MPKPFPDEGPPLVPLRCYPTLPAARTAALALAAREWVHEIDRDEAGWMLLVEESHHAEALAELALVEAEENAPRPVLPEREFSEGSPFSLFLVAMLLMAAFVAQNRFAPAFTDAGDADNTAILSGAWWRCFTALTLHADGTHLAANMATGALFAGFLVPQLGAGWTWLMVLLGGGMGNLINSWGYRGASHRSIGASTAVFAALGLLVAGEVFYRWRTRRAGAGASSSPSGRGSRCSPSSAPATDRNPSTTWRTGGVSAADSSSAFPPPP